MKLSCIPIFLSQCILIGVIHLISAKIVLIQGHQIGATSFPPKNTFRSLTHYARRNQVILNSLLKDSE